MCPPCRKAGWRASKAAGPLARPLVHYHQCIDVQVLRLRRKLEVDPSAPRVIRTERGIGYIFALPVQSL